MKPFLYKSALLIALLLVYSVGITTFNLYIISQERIHLNARNAAMGDSHLQTSIDPKYMARYVNVCQSAEPYLITYLKLKAIVQTNTLDTLLLGLSYHNLSANEDSFLKNNSSLQFFNRFYPILSRHDFKNIEYNHASYNLALIRNLALYPKLKHAIYLGGFNRRTRTLKPKKSKLALTLKSHYEDGNQATVPLGVSNLAYLDSIVNLSSHLNIKLILITTPLHPDYREAIPVVFIANFNQVKNRYKIQGVTILDRSEMYSSQESAAFFTDYDHLNTKGARDFTLRLKHDLIIQQLPIK